MADDQTIIAELNRLREPASRLIEHHREQERLGIWLQTPSPDFPELTKNLVELLKAHPDFGHGISRFFGPKQLIVYPGWHAINLLNVSVQRNAPAALTWLRKVQSTEKADI